MMIFYALLNGVCIAIARVLNGRLAAYRNAFYASWMNHFVGFLFLTAIILLTVGFKPVQGEIPGYIYFGGIVGALYVTLNSFIVFKLGITRASLFVIAGQLVGSLVLDLFLGKLHLSLSLPLLILVLGCMLIVFGFYQSLKER